MELHCVIKYGQFSGKEKLPTIAGNVPDLDQRVANQEERESCCEWEEIPVGIYYICNTRQCSGPSLVLDIHQRSGGGSKEEGIQETDMEYCASIAHRRILSDCGRICGNYATFCAVLLKNLLPQPSSINPSTI